MGHSKGKFTVRFKCNREDGADGCTQTNCCVFCVVLEKRKNNAERTKELAT